MSSALLPEETLSHKFISKWFWLYLFTLLTLPLWYIIRVILSNDMSVAEVGIIYSLIWLMWILSTLSTLWLSTEAMVYFLPKYIVKKDRDTTSTIYRIIRYINIGMTLIIWGAFYWFIQAYGNHYIDHPQATAILYIFLGIFLFLNLEKPLLWVFHTLQNVFIPNLTEFIKQGVIAFTIWTLFLFSLWDLIHYGYAFLWWAIISYLIYLITFQYKYSQQILSGKWIHNNVLFKQLIRFGLSALLAANAMLIIKNVDMQMLLVISGAEDAGYYSNYMSLMLIVMFFITPILSILYPIISELHSKWQLHKLSMLQSFLYKYVVVFAVSMIVFLWVFGEEIAVIFFGESFVYSGTLISLLAIFGLCKIIFSINFAILMWLWEVRKRANILIIVMLINIILNSILIPLRWALGAWIATGISWTIIAATTLYYVYQHQPIQWDRWFYTKNFILLILLWGTSYFITKDWFVLDNVYRYINLQQIISIWIIYYILIILTNLQEMKWLIHTIQQFRQK